jgi:hypothetical protein
MSMRVYVRVEKVTDVPQELLGTNCHIKLVLGNVIMRTRTRVVDDLHRALLFSEVATGRLNELFVFGAKSLDHLANMKLSLQLRRQRVFLRSHKTAEAIVPLALVDPTRSLKAAFPLRSADGDRPGAVSFGNVHVRIETEFDAQPATPTVEEAAGTNHAARETEGPTVANINVSPRSFSMLAPSSQPHQEVPSKRGASLVGRTAKMRQCGTQTDRLFMTESDLSGIADGVASGVAATHGPSAVGTVFNMANVGSPPPPEVFNTRRTFLPVDVLAQQKVAVAHPSDDIEGLILYCEQTQRYQRELETTLAKHSLDTARSRIRALQGGPFAHNTHSDPMKSLPLAEDRELEQMLSIL